jgi:hypothetical protein
VLSRVTLLLSAATEGRRTITKRKEHTGTFWWRAAHDQNKEQREATTLTDKGSTMMWGGIRRKQPPIHIRFHGESDST